MARKGRGYWLDQRNEIWRVCWTERGADGRSRKFTRSTRTSDKGEAEQWLTRFREELARPSQPLQPTVSSILDGYLHTKAGQVRDYRRLDLCARNLKRHLGWVEIDTLLPSHATRYTSQRTGQCVQPGTITQELRILRAALRWAQRERLVGQIPGLEMPPATPPRDRWLTREEAERLIEAATAPHVRLFIQLGLQTAARSGAILGLKWIEVDLERRVIDFGRDAGNKRRGKVPLNDSLGEALHSAQMAAQTPYVIEFAGKRVVRIEKGFRAAVRRAGIPHCSPHCLRHTAVTWAVQAGCSPAEVAAFAGHNVTTMWKTYAHHNPDWLRNVAKVLEG